MGITFDEPLAIDQKHFKNIASFLRYLEENNLLISIHQVDENDVSDEIKQQALQAKNDLETNTGFIDL